MVDLSVIVVSAGRGDTLSRCLDALLPQARAMGAEVLVVRRPGDGSRERLVAAHPEVAFVDATAEDNVPRMRARAIRQAAGSIVALLEDDCVVGEGWGKVVLAAQAAGHTVAGGPIEPDLYPSSLDRAVFLCEYGRFMSPFRGEVAALPGNNVSYRRPLVLEWLEGRNENGFLEVFAHHDWRARGIRLFADEGMAVRNIGRWTVETVTRTAFHHGRAFAGQRFEPGAGSRLAFAAGSPLLPLLKTLRVAGEALARPGQAGSLVRALPWIIVFHTSWAWGEMLGYLFGPGRSADRWGGRE